MSFPGPFDEEAGKVVYMQNIQILVMGKGSYFSEYAPSVHRSGKKRVQNNYRHQGAFEKFSSEFFSLRNTARVKTIIQSI
jgi:hypothetical protein